MLENLRKRANIVIFCLPENGIVSALIVVSCNEVRQLFASTRKYSYDGSFSFQYLGCLSSSAAVVNELSREC